MNTTGGGGGGGGGERSRGFWGVLKFFEGKRGYGNNF